MAEHVHEAKLIDSSLGDDNWGALIGCFHWAGSFHEGV
jgi:hypothetical protein